MNLKNLKSIFIMMTVLLSSVCAIAADSKSESSYSTGSARLTYVGKGSVKKRMPSKYVMEAIYSDGMLTLLSETYEGEFSLSFENCESGESYEVLSIVVGESVLLDLDCGEYEVNAWSEDGTMLSGILEVI